MGELALLSRIDLAIDTFERSGRTRGGHGCASRKLLGPDLVRASSALILFGIVSPRGLASRSSVAFIVRCDDAVLTVSTGVSDVDTFVTIATLLAANALRIVAIAFDFPAATVDAGESDTASLLTHYPDVC